MTTDSVFILFKKTNYNTILACLGVKCVGDFMTPDHKILVAKIGGQSFIDMDIWKIWDPLLKKMIAPLVYLCGDHIMNTLYTYKMAV